MFIGNKYYYICFSIPSIFMVLMDISYTLWTLRKPISISYPTCLFAQNCHFYLPHVGCFSCPVPSLCMIHPALWRLKPVTYIVNVKCRLCTCHSYCNARNLWHLCRCVILKRCLGIMYVQVSADWSNVNSEWVLFVVALLKFTSDWGFMLHPRSPRYLLNVYIHFSSCSDKKTSSCFIWSYLIRIFLSHGRNESVCVFVNRMIVCVLCNFYSTTAIWWWALFLTKIETMFTFLPTTFQNACVNL